MFLGRDKMAKKKVLIIDDDPNISELTKVLLEAQDYQVISAPGAAEGIKKAKSKKPDLVILDIMMPEMDGISVCQKLKADKKTGNIPIMMLTVKWLAEDKKKSLEAGACCYMTKPFETKELVEKVKQILAGK
jgi:DNA-binding response OmpR family regulator